MEHMCLSASWFFLVLCSGLKLYILERLKVCSTSRFGQCTVESAADVLICFLRLSCPAAHCNPFVFQEFQIVEAVIDEPIYAWPASFVAKAIVTRLVTDHCCTFLDFSPMCRVYMLGKQVPLRPMLTWDQRIAVVNKMPSFYRMFVGEQGNYVPS